MEESDAEYLSSELETRAPENRRAKPEIFGKKERQTAKQTAQAFA